VLPLARSPRAQQAIWTAPQVRRRAAAELERRRRLRARQIERWYHDPVAFAREALGVEPWGRQADILRAAAAHQRVAVRSGHKVGKSTSAVILALWWVVTRPRARVIMTSSSGRQVRAVLWKELRRVYRAAPYKIGGRLHKVPDAGLQFHDEREIVGFSTDEPEKMAGFSGPDILYIIDEASGVPEAIFEAIEGNRAGGATAVMFSNPTQTSGTFFDAFHSKAHLYERIRISSAETPNVLNRSKEVPGLATAEWIAEKQAEWGVDSPIYQVRIEGNFPAQGSNAVISLALVTQAEERWQDDEHARKAGEPPLLAEGPLELGVDPARFGEDESVIAPRRGKKAFVLRAFQNLDGVQLAGEVIRAIRELRRPGDPLPRVKVDVIGIGASCADQLRYHKGPDGRPELVLVEVNSAENATSEGYHRLRDQLWFAVVDWIKEGGALPPDSKLARDLVAPTYSFDVQARRQVESKEKTKGRLKNSPDRADALALSIHQGRSLPTNLPKLPAVKAAPRGF